MPTVDDVLIENQFVTYLFIQMRDATATTIQRINFIKGDKILLFLYFLSISFQSE